jgi:hypothetical protein
LAGFVIVMPQVLPVVWHRLVWLIKVVGAAAAAGQPAAAVLAVVDVILLLLPWAGSLLLLVMMARGPARWVVDRWSPARLQGRS